jgi:hypothetical protein
MCADQGQSRTVGHGRVDMRTDELCQSLVKAATVLWKVKGMRRCGTGSTQLAI